MQGILDDGSRAAYVETIEVLREKGAQGVIAGCTEIEQLITRLNLDHHVTISPPVPQDKLRQVYNRAAVVVLNSYQEGFGLALSEAMLCGAAVIGARSGGITDIIEDSQRGLLVPPDDSSALADAIIELLSNTNRRRALAEVPVFNGMHRFLPSLLRAQGYRVAEIFVNHRPRTRGSSKYGIGNRLWRGIRDCFAMRWYRARAVPADRIEGDV